MAMKDHYADKNGVDRRFIHQLQEIVGRVRFGWAVAATVLSPMFLFGALMVHNGFVALPAKDADLKIVQTTLATQGATILSQGEAIKALTVAVVELKEGAKAQQQLLSKVDRGLDRLIELHMTQPEDVPSTRRASTAPASPPADTRRRVKKPAPEQEKGWTVSPSN